MKTTSEMSRRDLLRNATTLAVAAPLAGAIGCSAADQSQAGAGPGCSEWTQPTDADFGRIVGKDKVEFLKRALSVIENEVAPLTAKGIETGSKLFGAAILNKSDLSTVLAATNTETDNPLYHGEITAINTFYAMPKEDRPPASDCIFVSTHEPCPLCLSGITWGGFDNFFYLFTYEDSRDAYGIPHDIVMIDEIFRCPEGSYNENNKYWSSWGLKAMVASAPEADRDELNTQLDRLVARYAELSAIYQKKKEEGTGADVPFK